MLYLYIYMFCIKRCQVLINKNQHFSMCLHLSLACRGYLGCSVMPMSLTIVSSFLSMKFLGKRQSHQKWCQSWSEFIADKMVGNWKPNGPTNQRYCCITIVVCFTPLVVGSCCFFNQPIHQQNQHHQPDLAYSFDFWVYPTIVKTSRSINH